MLENGYNQLDWLTTVVRETIKNNPYPEIKVTHAELDHAASIGSYAAVAMSPRYAPWVRAESVASLLTKDTDLDVTASFYDEPGVYILFDDHNVLYVGQSHKVKSRVTSHKNVPFTNAVVIYCQECDLIAFEALALGMLRPVLNFRRSTRYQPTISEPSKCHEYGL